MKRVFITGVDGYLGWSLAQYLADQDYVVSGIDDWQRRKSWVPSCGSDSAIPISSPESRVLAFKEHFGGQHFDHVGSGAYGNVARYVDLCLVLEKFKPDVLVNLAQMPSAPFSMKDFDHANAAYINNMGTMLSVLWAIKDVCPSVPIITIGTAGEYGTPGIKITEGDVTVSVDGRSAELPFPKTPSSLYHATKVASTVVLERACVWWGLAATDIMQGVVYGVRHEHMSDDPRMATRMDFDECFGTAINRFVVQAVIDHPLTVYGAGTQRRGFLPLRDSMRCLQLLIDNSPDSGKVRIINQYDQVYSILELAEAVQEVAREFGFDPRIENVVNPRWELEKHFYEMEREKLVQLGYMPKGELKNELREMFEVLKPHRERLEVFRSTVAPKTTWG
jgi:UDP-sulfoquinovose synthase